MDLFHQVADDCKDTQSIDKECVVLPDPNQKNNVESARKRASFSELGLCQWVCEAASAMGLKRPTPIQQRCIPAIFQNRDILACAETGSGKTAAFALPILQLLSEDPFGIYCLILTPTRELAIQINEQFLVLGASFGIRTCLVLGGVGMTEQSLELSKLPHIVVATPGRMRHHLQTASPPNLSRARFLVLDEADRLMSSGFSEELHVIFSEMRSPFRRTLLFSATLSQTMQELRQTNLGKDALLVDLTVQQKMPEQLQQQFIFLPARIKTCYLIAVLLRLIRQDADSVAAAAAEDGHGGNGRKRRETAQEIICNEVAEEMEKRSGHMHKKNKNKKKKEPTEGPSHRLQSYSAIIFVSTCSRCQQTAAILRNMDVDCVALHSIMTQRERMQALNKFKSMTCRILIATDVASRGLDIPTVNLVLNFDLPKLAEDYVHRVGRTARAGKGGRSISFVTQFEISLLHAIEDVSNVKMQPATELQGFIGDPDGDDGKEFIKLLNPVSKAMRLATMQLNETGFAEKVEVVKKRKRRQKRQILRKFVRLEKNDEA